MSKASTRIAWGIVLTLAVSAASAWAGTCGVSSLSVYATPGFSCTTGNDTFSNFNAALVSAAGTPGSVGQVTVFPTGGGPNPGLSFGADYDASGLATDSLTIIYAAMASPGSFFTGATLSLSNPSVSGLGLLTADELLCLNGTFSPLEVCSSGVTDKFTELSSVTGNLNVVETLALSGDITEVGVLKTIDLSGLTGSASASELNNSFTVTPTRTPEPLSLALFGSGLVLLAQRLRRRIRHGEES
jgi:hypothetical protein